MAAKSARVGAIPEGYHTVTPYLVVRGAERAIEFYKKALARKNAAAWRVQADCLCMRS